MDFIVMCTFNLEGYKAGKHVTASHIVIMFVSFHV